MVSVSAMSGHDGQGTLGVVEIDGMLYEVRRVDQRINNGRDDGLVFDPLATTDEVEKR